MSSFAIVHEDPNVIVVNKLLPVPVQKDKSGDLSLQDELRAFLATRDGKEPAFLEAIHRLDRRSSGLVVFARTQESASILSESLAKGRIKKTYWAVVDKAPEPEEGRIESLLFWDARKDKSFVVQPGSAQEKDAKKATLSYKVKGRSERYVCLQVELETGRSHQIRAQLASIGLPIRGDLKYGARRSTNSGLIMLHAQAVSFRHPISNETVSLTADPPAAEALWAAFS